MHPQDDILASLESQENKPEVLFSEKKDDFIPNEVFTQNDIFIGEIKDTFQEENILELYAPEVKEEIKTPKKSLWKTSLFFIKYLTTSASIFALLLLASNYSAYWNIAKSIIFAEELEQTKQSLIESVAAGNILGEESSQEVNTFRNLSDSESMVPDTLSEKHSIGTLMKYETHDSLDIEITPYENRIVIPKIGKNIPLIDITHPNVQGLDELNDIFMKELENGVVRYPGSAKPGETGNAFIFGHSSNFPWMEGRYNDVFALLDKVVFDDEVVVYYGQEKYVYKIRSKNVIRPGDVSVLKNNPEIGASEITLMTCWPIGTTLNRLVLTGELIRVEK